MKIRQKINLRKNKPQTRGKYIIGKYIKHIFVKKSNMKSLFVAILCLISASVFAQVTDTSYTPYERSGQMLVAGKTYTGLYKDTITNSGTLYLTVVKGKNAHLSNNPIWGQGTLDIKCIETKISGAPYGNMRLQASNDGSTWADVAYNYTTTIYVDSMVIDSVSGTKAKTWHVMKTQPYYRAYINIPSGTQASSYQAYWYYTKNQYIPVNK